MSPCMIEPDPLSPLRIVSLLHSQSTGSDVYSHHAHTMPRQQAKGPKTRSKRAQKSKKAGAQGCGLDIAEIPVTSQLHMHSQESHLDEHLTVTASTPVHSQSSAPPPVQYLEQHDSDNLTNSSLVRLENLVQKLCDNMAEGRPAPHRPPPQCDSCFPVRTTWLGNYGSGSARQRPAQTTPHNHARQRATTAPATVLLPTAWAILTSTYVQTPESRRQFWHGKRH